MAASRGWIVGAVASLLVAGCAHEQEWPPRQLRSWELFSGEPRLQRPAPGVEPYEINTPLFSDYATKLRFVKLPQRGKIVYSADDVLEFPVGTVIAKTFAYPETGETAGSAPLRLIETRILTRTRDGWIGLPYVWNDEQTGATLALAGARRSVSFADPAGNVHALEYRVPNANQCKGCHRDRGREMRPIGPRAAQLNREREVGGERENQLERWRRIGWLEGAPPAHAAPRYPEWNDGTAPLEARARAWLEINCAHCHNPEGPAGTSSLDLRFVQSDPTRLGVYKSPVAAGRGSGDRLHDIVPGRPERSILVYRLESTDPGIMMPELGRSLVDAEGVALIREWIESMDDELGKRAIGRAERAAG